MRFGLRKLIYKIPGMHRLATWLVTLENNIFYAKLNKKTGMKNKIASLKNSAKKTKCFIVGNGPSLTIQDLRLIKDEDCLASNLIFKLFDKTDWRPKYYFIQDPYADISNGLKFFDKRTKLFYGDSFLRKHKEECASNVYCFKTKRCSNNNVKFSTDVSSFIFSHYTITYTMIQFAVYMGYKKIILLGMDHNYNLTVDSRGRVTEKKDVVSHVFKDENPQEVVANIEGMNSAYLKAKEMAEQNGFEIINATRGGHLNWFKRMNLENVLYEG